MEKQALMVTTEHRGVFGWLEFEKRMPWWIEYHASIGQEEDRMEWHFACSTASTASRRPSMASSSTERTYKRTQAARSSIRS